MELIMKTDLEKSIPTVIDFNYDEMKTELAGKMEKYNNLVVTEDGIKDAKSDKANLSKLSKALNDSRISQEKTYMQPFNDYKAKVNELIALISKPILAIDGQIKAFEDIEKENKFAAITHFYKTNIDDLVDVLPLEKVLNPKWANATVTFLSVTQEMIDRIMTAHNDLRIIEAMKLDCEAQMKDCYLKNLNMSEALAEKARFEQQQERLAEIKAKQAAQAHQEARKNAEKAVSTPPQEHYVVKKSFAPPTAMSTSSIEETKTIKAIFYNTTAAFRDEMNALTTKYDVKCEGIQ